MFPWLASGAGLLGGALKSFGSLFGVGGARSDRKSAEKQARKNRQLQMDFAKHGIRWRVQDAIRAGVHPLYALGANLPSYSPVEIGGQGRGDEFREMGQALERAFSATASQEERLQQQLELDVLRSTIRENDARAGYFESEAARSRQSDQTGPALSIGDGAVKTKPDEVISHRGWDASTVAGTHPGWTEYTLTKFGTKIRLPWSSEGPSETLENIPFWMWPSIIQYNRSYYGPNWGSDVITEMFGGQQRYGKGSSGFKSGDFYKSGGMVMRK